MHRKEKLVILWRVKVDDHILPRRRRRLWRAPSLEVARHERIVSRVAAVAHAALDAARVRQRIPQQLERVLCVVLARHAAALAAVVPTRKQIELYLAAALRTRRRVFVLYPMLACHIRL